MPWPCSDDDRRSSLSAESDAIRGPMPKGEKDLHFPIYNPVDNLDGVIWTYCAMQMASGNGFPPRQVVGVVNRPEKHFRQGVGIGDVGILGADGGFSYFFNIFYPRDDPIQTVELPHKFKPMEPPLSDWQIRTTENHFSPGTAITSEGVLVNKTSESPLKVEFSSSAFSGAALVLPNGARRDDLVDVDKLHSYLKEHASDWYHFFNGYGGTGDTVPSPPIMNGTILLITGSDRVLTYASATFTSSNEGPANVQHTFSFDETHQDWWLRNRAQVKVTSRKGALAEENLVSVFYRGLTVALSTPLWLRHLPLIPFDEVPCYSVLSTPATGLRARLGQFIAMRRGTTMEAFDRRMRVPFHPAAVLVQMLLQANPTAEYAIVDDSVWCSLINGKNPTHQQLPILLKDILDTYDIVTTEGIVTFVKKGSEKASPEDPSVVSYLMSLLRKSPKTRALQAIPNILSVPGKEYR